MNEEQKKQLAQAIDLLHLIDEQFCKIINSGKSTREQNQTSNKIYSTLRTLREL